jgi:hypothetical protein
VLRRLLSALARHGRSKDRSTPRSQLDRRQEFQRPHQATPQAGHLRPDNNPPAARGFGTVKKILEAYRKDGRPYERVGEWVERIGWPRFFEMTGLPFTRHHIDDWRWSRPTLNTSAHLRF